MRKKYPRTLHMPFSPGYTSDDKVLKSLSHFEGKQVVVTVKMDGENTTMYTDGYHARSLDSAHHPSRDWLARFHAEVGYNIPAGWRVCGENLYAQHSIAYFDLPAYFLAFSVWNEHNRALSWADTELYLQLLGIPCVQVLYQGEFSEAKIKAIVQALDLTKNEGIVMRLADEFAYEDFSRSVAKWVRPGHVGTDTHWMHQAVQPNWLASK